jgi:NAD(P)-dependent dehydrogenase (short-subunit alcohol dehydrogenase family)
VRRALVTGANTGIGYAIAERLLRDGFELGFATQHEEDADREAFERLAKIGPRMHWVSGDLSDPDVPERLVREMVEALGSVDVLVNNAGLTLAKPALELTAEDFDRIFTVDVRAAFLLSREAASRMADGGVIVNITSVHEHVPRAGLALYAAAKAALGMLTKSLALELGPRGIRVNSVAPGVIATERNLADATELDPEVPLGRPGEPAEVANLVAWLCSDEARYVTGASYLIDGGMAIQVVSTPAT